MRERHERQRPRLRENRGAGACYRPAINGRPIHRWNVCESQQRGKSGGVDRQRSKWILVTDFSRPISSLADNVHSLTTVHCIHRFETLYSRRGRTKKEVKEINER